MRSDSTRRHILWTMLAAFAVAAGPALAGGGGGSKAKPPPAEESDEGHGGAKIYGSQYINLDPFTVPFLGPQGPDGQMNVVIALEIADPQRRTDVMRDVPRLRAAIYESLFGSLTTRSGRYIPSDEKLKRVVRKAAEKVIQRELLADVLIQQVFENRPVGR
ncbi:MAG: hypothetical protein AB7K86_03755 [Rhodospirillales bacterium]